MVRIDVKQNYYADLDLTSDATTDDIKKQFKKLALKYHPDRNPGREAECIPKFQAIQAAHEVLADPDQRAKYDADRRKAGLFSNFARTGTASGASRTNPYAASSPFPPPPRRAATNRYASDATPNGASRYANFPKAPGAERTSSGEDAQDKAEAWKAWSNIHNRKQQHSQRPQPRPPTPPRNTRPQPSPNAYARTNTAFNNVFEEAERNVPRPSPRSAFEEVNTGRGGRGGPGMYRSASTRTPRKTAGYDPSTPLGDEPAASSRTGYSPRPTRQTPPNVPGDMPPPPPRGTAPTAKKPDPLHHFRAYAQDDVPFTEGNRIRTPYGSATGERTYFTSEDLRRSQSTKDTTKKSDTSHNTPTEEPRPEEPPRRRSDSPLRRPYSNQEYSTRKPEATTSPRDGKAKKPGAGTATRPFVVYSSSDDSELSDAASSPHAYRTPGRSSDPEARRAGPKQNGTKVPLDPANRPKATPAPAWYNKANGQRTASDDSIPGAAKESKYKHTMYEQTFSLFSSNRNGRSSEHGTAKQSDGMKSNGAWPYWAIPSTVSPVLKKGTGAAQELRNDIKGLDIASAKGVLHDPAAGRKDSAFPGFTFPVNDDTFSPTSKPDLRSRSHESINMKFTPTEWDGKFTGGDYFTPAPGTANKDSKGRSPTRGRPTSSMKDNSSSAYLSPNLFVSGLNPKLSESEVFGLFTRYGQVAFCDLVKDPTTRQLKGFGFVKMASVEAADAARNALNGMKIEGHTLSVQQARKSSVHETQNGTPPDLTMPPPPAKGRGPVPPPSEVKFSAEEWAQHFREPTWVYDPTKPPSPTRPTSAADRRVKTSRSRAPSKSAESSKKPPVTPKPAAVEETFDSEASAGGSVKGVPLGTPHVDDDAMDIDPLQTSPDPALTPKQPPVVSPTPKSEARPVSVKPQRPEWHDPTSDNIPYTQTHSRRRSASGVPRHVYETAAPPPAPTPPLTKAKTDTATLNVNLSDLKIVAPINATATTEAGTASGGLKDLSSLAYNLPFPSTASSDHPTKSLKPTPLQPPQPPQAPTPPATLTQWTWTNHYAAMFTYMVRWNKFNATMLAHFAERQRVASMLMAPTNEGGDDGHWLTAMGEPSAEGKVGFRGYLNGLEQDEAVREHWNVACDRHKEVMERFGVLREKVAREGLKG